MRDIIVIAHNLRSTHNIGSIIRSSDGFGATKVICTGYTPYPVQPDDTRLPHEQLKLTKQINKTALDAAIPVSHREDITKVIDKLRQQGYTIIAIEQAKQSIPLNEYTPDEKLALIVGREVEGIEREILKLADAIVEIPMFGRKESFNVSIAAAIALYHCRFTP